MLKGNDTDTCSTRMPGDLGRLHVLMVIPYFEWSFGGPVLVTVELTAELARRGHDVTVITTDMGFSHRLDHGVTIETPGVRVLCYPVLSYFLAKKLQFQYSLSLGQAVAAEVARADVVHLQEARSIPNAQVWRAARAQGVPVVLQSHGAAYYRVPGAGRLSSLLKRSYDLVVGRRIWRDAWRIYALNADEARFYEERGIARVRIVPNGIVPPQSLPPPGEFRRRHGLPPSVPLILYLGRINETKGLELLVRAFAELAEPDARLVFIGPDDGYLEELLSIARSLGVNDRLLYTGFIEADQKVAAFVDADLFATPRFFGFPMTFLEAAACATPIVTTDAGDRLDWIDGDAGIVTSYDVAAYADALASLVSNPELRERLGRRAAKIVRERFSWERIADVIETDYRDGAALDEKPAA